MTSILLDIDPDVNIHVAVPLSFAKSTFNPHVSERNDSNENDLVCLGCYATPNSYDEIQQISQSYLIKTLLDHHNMDITRDSHLSVQLTMTQIIPYNEMKRFHALILDTTREIEDIYHGRVHLHLNGHPLDRDLCCGVAVQFRSLDTLISWLSCGRNAEVKLGYPSLSTEKAAFVLTAAPFPETDILASSTSCDLLLQEYMEPPDLHSPEPVQDHKHVPIAPALSPTSIADFVDVWTVSQPIVVSSASFVDADGTPLDFKPMYYRNNKKGGIRNLRCFPQCKRGKHSTTSFCGDNLRVRLNLTKECGPGHAPIVAFARFRNTFENYDEYVPGMLVPHDTIRSQVRSKENPKAMWMQTKAIESNLFEIRPAGRSLSWHYGFHAGNLHKTKVHLIEILFFVHELTQQDTLRCIGMTRSTPFRIVSSRSKED